LTFLFGRGRGGMGMSQLLIHRRELEFEVVDGRCWMLVHIRKLMLPTIMRVAGVPSSSSKLGGCLFKKG